MVYLQSSVDLLRHRWRALYFSRLHIPFNNPLKKILGF